ncbi:hypothetical protein [Ralstonia syzygii]|uniref:hypothetical protein n=1 Tax=Ralstonia syzygii TaxID=28097 RepID=UPI0018D1BD42|nr:hypothetical protein [Ralstonia syzygii]
MVVAVLPGWLVLLPASASMYDACSTPVLPLDTMVPLATPVPSGWPHQSHCSNLRFCGQLTPSGERKKINASSNANVGYGLASCGLVDSVSSDWLQSI